MALSKPVTVNGAYQFAYEGGVTTTQADATLELANAYIVVHAVEGTKQQMRATVHIRGEGVAITKFYSFGPSVEDDAGNFIKQAYLHLKTLPEFAGAIDC
jgi:VCBS repeat-containing protein